MSSHKSKSSFGGVVFGLIFFIVGSLILYFGALRTLGEVMESQTWATGDCQVTSSEVAISRDSDGTTYRADIRMRWSFEDGEHSGGSYNFSDMYSSGYNGKKEIVDQYPVGSTHLCWINPDSPWKAVLNRDIPGVVYVLIPFSAIFMLVGGVVMLASLGLIKGSWSANFRNRHQRVAPTALGFTELQATSGAKKTLLVALIFCLFWNGIVSLFVADVVSSHMSGNADWFQTIFMIPFVAVGIGLVGFVIHSFLATFNPKACLSVNEGRPHLGQEITLQWRFNGNASRIQSFELKIVGEERATYRQGTNTVTDEHVFYEEVLCSTTTQTEIESGKVNIKIPENSMHSFNSGNNKIVWYIELHGDIAKWPDVKNNYELTVRPGA